MKYEMLKYKTLPSTNDEAKRLAKAGAPEGTVVVADSQTHGRGRGEHTFFSPPGGVYMSVILRPRFSELTLITPAAAAAVCRALDGLGFDCRIKWVNDIYKDGKKVCGVLAESNAAEGWTVLGIGLNVAPPGEGAPDIAGHLYNDPPEGGNGRVIRAILSQLERVYEKLPDDGFIEYYRDRSYLSGKSLSVNGEKYEYAGIGDGFSLIVKNENGYKTFISAEINIVINN